MPDLPDSELQRPGARNGLVDAAKLTAKPGQILFHIAVPADGADGTEMAWFDLGGLSAETRTPRNDRDHRCLPGFPRLSIPHDA